MSARKAGKMGNGQMRRPADAVLLKLCGATLVLAIAIGSVPEDAAARSPIACGTVYTVTRGDTLFKIAERAFGNGKLYKQIFKANSGVLPNSASIEVGNELLIPCLDSAGQIVREDAVAQEPSDGPADPEVTADAVAMEPVRTEPGLLTRAAQLVVMATSPMQSIAGPIYSILGPASITTDEFGATGPAESEPQAVIPRIRLLTSTDLAPFSDEILPRGGLITDLVSRALDAAAPGQQTRVAFINDRAAHLNYLLPEGAFDVSFPWFKPDCSNSERLDAEMQRRCAEFAFSNPIFEVRVGFYTRRGDALVEATNLAALSGKRLCRPAGRFSFDLDRNSLVAPDVPVETRYTAQQCFARLAEGKVDAVTLVKSGVDEQLGQLGIADSVTEISGLESTRTLHALVSKQSPNGQANLDLVNRGLAELMASGKWFEVVAFHQGRQLALMN